MGKGDGLLGRDGPDVPQIAFVSYQHNNNVCVRVIPQLFQPAFYILKRDVLVNVVYEECPDRATVVRARDRTVPFLPRRVPYLRLDRLSLRYNASKSKLNIN